MFQCLLAAEEQTIAGTRTSSREDELGFHHLPSLLLAGSTISGLTLISRWYAYESETFGLDRRPLISYTVIENFLRKK